MNRRAPILAAVGMVLLVILVVFFAVLPKMRQVTERREELREAELREQTLLAELDRLQEARAQLPEARRRLARFNQKVPAQADLPGIIRLVQNAADASLIGFVSITPGTPQPAAGAAPATPATPPPTETDPDAPPPLTATPDASVIQATIVVIGDFFAVDQFLFRLETLPRAAKVTGIQVAGSGEGADDPGTLNVTLTVEFFTTDPDAGPGTAPEEAVGESPAPAPSPAPSPAATSPAAPATATPTTPAGG